MVGGAEFIGPIFHISYDSALYIFALIVAAYVIAGGLKGVMMTDALQGGIMLVGMIILLALVEIIPAAKDVLTGGLLAWAANLALGAGEPAWAALAVCLGVIAAALAACVLLFRRQEL